MTLRAEDEPFLEGETVLEGECQVEGEHVPEGELYIEGEEVEPDGLQSVDLVFPSGDIFIAPGTLQVEVVLAARIQGEGEEYKPETTRVYFILDNRYVPAEGHFGDLFYLPCVFEREADLPFESIHIQIVAYDEDGEHFVESPFYSPQVFEAEDLDGNGFVDDPFAFLSHPGDCWISESVGNTGLRRIFMMSLAPDSGTTPLIFLSRSEEPEEEEEGEGEGEEEVFEGEELSETKEMAEESSYILLETPNRLVEPVEKGILIFALAADADDLFAPYETAEMLSLQPGLLAQDGMYQDVKLLLTIDEGKSFYDVPESRTVRRPLLLTFPSPSPGEGTRLEFAGYPSFIDSHPDFGFGLAPDFGIWSTSGISASSWGAAAGYTQLSLTRLPVIAPFEVFTPGFLTVSPSPDAGFNFGEVPVNEPVFTKITLSNPGDTPVNCSVRMQDPERVFFLQSAQSLLLAPGASSTFTLQFNPREAKKYTATLIFESSDGNYQTMTVQGRGEEEGKESTFLGCGGKSSEGTSAFNRTDLLLVMLLSALLFLVGREKQRG